MQFTYKILNLHPANQPKIRDTPAICAKIEKFRFFKRICVCTMLMGTCTFAMTALPSILPDSQVESVNVVHAQNDIWVGNGLYVDIDSIHVTGGRSKYDVYLDTSDVYHAYHAYFWKGGGTMYSSCSGLYDTTSVSYLHIQTLADEINLMCSRAMSAWDGD